MKLLLVGGYGGTQVATSLLRAAQIMQIESELLDTNQLTSNSRIVRGLLWHIGDRKLPKMIDFNQAFVNFVEHKKPDVVITTGNAPVFFESLMQAKQFGVKLVNYSTDDPFNPIHKSRWFLKALTAYDVVFSPRKINICELKQVCQGKVRYLPFAYDPDIFYKDSGVTKEDHTIYVGTGDSDRYPLMQSIINSGLPLKLYGQYWEKDKQLKEYAYGQTNADEIRKATSRAQIAICLVRRANRDGHVMRTFEIPACGTAMLVEHTEEHESIFGEDGECVRYFYRDDELVSVLKEMMLDKEKLPIYASKVKKHICGEGNTYLNRLQEMLLFI